MIELDPKMVGELVRTRALGRFVLGAICMLSRTMPAWANEVGTVLLVRWEGERLPLPSLDPADRAAIIVGQAWPADAGAIETWSDVTHAANTVYHYGLMPVSGGGVVGPINPFAIQTRTIDGAGSARGFMPNAPSGLAARIAPGNRPVLRWHYSAAHQQTPPVQFGVYATSGASFNFASPAALVDYRRGQTRYEWLGAALSANDVRHYTVRAKSGSGVLSLIPQTGRCPSGDYDAVDLSRCPRLQVASAAPPGAASMWGTVV